MPLMSLTLLLPHCPQVDMTLFAEFQAWRAAPTLDKACPFLDRVYREDVGPCLDFTMHEVRKWQVGSQGPAQLPPATPSLALLSPKLSALVRGAVEDNTLTIEPVASHMQPNTRAAAVEGSHTR